MDPHVLAAGTSTTGWVVGYTIGIVIVVVVVALVVPILMLARSIGNEAPKINDALGQAVLLGGELFRFHAGLLGLLPLFQSLPLLLQARLDLV